MISTDRSTPPHFLDFEASSLSISSYPIQVAWSLPDGTIRSPFISPDTIDYWTDWDDYAEFNIHQISRELLAREGLSPSVVAQAMNASLEGQTVYVDGGAWDRIWLEELFVAADLQSLFALGDAHDLIEGLAPDMFATLSDYEKADRWRELEERAFADLGLRPHRADTDVRAMLWIYEHVLAMDKEVRS